ncbi:hypothetical protein TVAG_016680 [Trichomonas vaginalis G3]|uniref:EF hand family protein n=1 Tax=Trichomonas vaginalis (strain ATCC PRA-98 / G3) TaxID=412133 RepID=A2ER06_TRIV3|nr:WD40 repeat domain 95 family [Trichomonas vaginalis G3]EAY04896.1 hypothetical protein TVAG_016680 [Trichomonas vaginalis G3]KAI5519446.1 WD40 repeat domain 95 family [Trichomonas vaginalis G3]|eukprot:XP_001317119.1 hypothetical protein [Trichomonas vaginalis G3]
MSQGKISGDPSEHSHESSETNLVNMSHAQIVNSLPGKTWIEKLRIAYEDVTGSIENDISLDKWNKSNLKYLIEDSILSDDQMIEYFQQIDANTDYNISWSELVAYIMMHQKNLTSGNIDKKLNLSFFAPDEVTIQKNKRSARCLRARYIHALEQIITLTETTLTFWSLECIPIRTFTDKDKFVDFCCLDSIFKLAIAKQNRQIIFYDLRNHSKLNYFISATLDSNAVQHYNSDETRAAIANCRRRRIPLFNTPTAMESLPEYPILFIGDQEGRVEVFHVHGSRAGKSEWTSTRIKHAKIHNQAVSQILYIPQLDVFASSSIDGTLAIWHFSLKTNDLNIEQVFKEPNHLPIISFCYEHRTRDYIYNTPSHCFGIWRTGTLHSQTVETSTQVVSTMTIATLSPESSFLVTITKNNFFSIYRIPNMEPCGNWFMGLQHELCPPTAALCTGDYLYLVGAFVSSWKVENGSGEGLRACTNPIVNVHVNSLFKKVLTCDNRATIASWDLLSGLKEFSYTLEEKDAIVSCFALDTSQRRAAVGYSNGLVHIVTANSGSILFSIEPAQLEGSCHALLFAQIFGNKKLLCSNGNRSVVLFSDIQGNRMAFHRNFVGHTENIISMAVLKERVIVTIGSEKEMFLWSVTQQNPLVKYSLPGDPTIVVDIPTSSDTFLAGDTSGSIHILRLDYPTPIKSIDVFGMSISSAITSLYISKTTPYIFIANMHGYMKIMSIEPDGSYTDHKMFRPHPMGIINCSLSEQDKVMVTAGLDQEVKMWNIEQLQCIGTIGFMKKWKLNDPKTWSGSSVPEDPVHFQKPDESVEEEEFPEEEEKIKRPPPINIDALPLPEFTYEGTRNMLDTSEEQNEDGKKLIEKVVLSMKEPPKSARVIKPVVPKMTFADLIESRHMENTITFMQTCREIKPTYAKYGIKKV